MNTDQRITDVIEAISDLVGSCTADELALMEALDALAEGWRMRLQEVREERD